MKRFLLLLIIPITIFSCNSSNKSGSMAGFDVEAEEFADIKVLRYNIPGWDELSDQQHELLYYLYEAALSGRDIIYDQKSKYGLTVRKTIENIYGTYSGNKSSDEWKKFEEYCGRFWFSNGYFHHYGNEKFIPECSYEYFVDLAKKSDPNGFPLTEGETVDNFLARMETIMFDINFEPKCVNQDANADNVAESANNFYEGVTQAEVEAYYKKFPSTGNQPSWGLNTKVMKDENGNVIEKVWKSGGMYGAAIDKITYWLEKASTVAENEKQKKHIDLLVKYYKSGDLKDFDDYSIAWVEDTESSIDFINGFIEVYLDAIGIKGSFESVVNVKDVETSKRIATISDNAQWFEDNSPLIESHKKKDVKGINAKVINAVVESGDAAPSTPIGINLPNADWIRKNHGSKSVNLGNIVDAYDNVKKKSGFLEEFEIRKDIVKRAKKHGALGSKLHTDMHECIGHASGQINEGIETPDKTLKTYASCLEEARADLVALYYITDQKLVDIGVMPSVEVGKAEYDSYIRNGLMTQLVRLKLGDNIEEAHMRNRQLNAAWVYEKGKEDNVIEWYKEDNKTYIKINDYEKLNDLFGQLLREIQRIKSEGDYAAGKALVENYGVKVNQALHKEVLERYKKLDTKPYSGFIQPRLVAGMNDDGEVTGVKVEYPKSFFKQMMEYGKNYSFLPVMN
jgi:dipeptidyl-peptidase-3